MTWFHPHQLRRTIMAAGGLVITLLVYTLALLFFRALTMTNDDV